MRKTVLCGLHAGDVLFGPSGFWSSSLYGRTLSFSHILHRNFTSAKENNSSGSVTARGLSTNGLRDKTSTSIFGIVRVGSAQFKVARDDLIFVDKLTGRKLKEEVLLSEVLMISDTSLSKVGRPTVENAKIYATVEEHYLNSKQMSLKKRPRKGYRRLAGLRQERTALRIMEIVGL